MPDLTECPKCKTATNPGASACHACGQSLSIVVMICQLGGSLLLLALGGWVLLRMALGG